MNERIFVIAIRRMKELHVEGTGPAVGGNAAFCFGHLRSAVERVKTKLLTID